MSTAFTVWLAVAAAGPAADAPAIDPAVRDIAGKYDGKGTDITGAAYATTVTIDEEGDAFRVGWNSMGQKYVGVGIRSGKVLSVGWLGQAGPNTVQLGVMVYEVQKDGSLEGQWTMLGAKGKVRTESLTRVKE
jgi:hypothetical protein